MLSRWIRQIRPLVLFVKDRKPTLSAIPGTAFPPFGPLPLMPEVTDNLKMDLLPDDAPSVISRLVNNARLLREG